MAQHTFRRPAILDPGQAEAIVGDADPAGDAEVAHTSAWALLGIPGEAFDEEHVQQLRAVAEDGGVDKFADLWDRSPAFTLPGALWRLYLLWQWNETDPTVLRERFADGANTLEKQDIKVPVDLDQALKAVDLVLTGGATEDDLETALLQAAAAMNVMATGVVYGPDWILEDSDRLAHPVTRRPKALLKTATELEESAKMARTGSLD